MRNGKKKDGQKAIASYSSFLFPVWQLPYFSLSVVPRVTGMIARADRGLDLEQNHENTKLVVCTSLCYNFDHEKWDV